LIHLVVQKTQQLLQIKVIRRYLEDEALDKGLKQKIQWVSFIRSCPQQDNGYDCGIFMLKNVECRIEGKLFDFGPKEI